MESNIFVQLGVSLFLGLLVGLQRQHTDDAVAGIRTFSLLTIFGTVCGWLAKPYGGWVIAAGLLALAGLLIAANLARVKSGDIDPGLTTEIAALVLFGVGVGIATGLMAAAVTLGGVVAVLLHLKQPLHRFAAAIGEKDMRAIMQFVLVTLVILPLLPNQTYGPYQVLNPFKIWLFVVLVIGMSLGAYVIFKFVGSRAGIWLAGILGGIISSTATTVSYARHAHKTSNGARAAVVIITIASTILYARLLVLLALAAPGSFSSVALPLTMMLIACLGITVGVVLFHRKTPARITPPGNPAELQTALILGAVYTVIRFGSVAAQEHFGAGGLYAVAILGGFTDVDAVALSVAQPNGDNASEAAAGSPWRAILIASLSNLVFKGVLVAILGGRELVRLISVPFGAILLAGAAILWLG